MSRFEGKFTATGDAQLSMEELLGLMEERFGGSKRQEAMTRCLSGEEGWREAIQALGGSFASLGTNGEKLSPGKAE